MKKTIIITAGLLYFTSLVTPVGAQSFIPVNAKIEVSEPLTVKFLGSQDNFLVFRVEVKTGDINLSTLKVEDAIEGELYSNTIYSNSKYQVFKIEKRENQILDFKLESQKKVYVKTFTTYSNEKLVQKGLAVL